MSNKMKVAALLERAQGEILSGEALAQELGISRTAVWKHMKSLMEDGYPIRAVANKGYCLQGPIDRLSREQILQYLTESSFGKEVFVFTSLDSTNETAKDLARKGAQHGTLVVAEEQIRGKGRQGKTFHSPKGQGIYMSLILRPDMRAEEALQWTIQAGVAVALVLEEWMPAPLKSQVKIKWVNDVFIQDRKVAGILTEAALEMESGKVDYLILGIGLNVRGELQDLPESIRDTAGFLSQYQPELPSRNECIGRILNRLDEIVYREPYEQTIISYGERSYLTGKRIRFKSGHRLGEGLVLGVDPQGGLEVVFENGAREVLHSGEVELLKGKGGLV